MIISDSNTAVGAGLAILASKDIMLKLLGPTADYIGGEMRGLVEKCNINVGNIFSKMQRKLGDRINANGEVNPRVIKNTLDDGKFCDEELISEYYAGILASSRSSNSRDDVGVSQIAILKTLSVYQVRLHYLFYSELHRVYFSKKPTLAQNTDRARMRLNIPFKVFFDALLQPGDDQITIMTHAITGLVRAELLGMDWQSGSASDLQKRFGGATKDGIVLEPTLPGAELFIWANGKQKVAAHALLQNQIIDELMCPGFPSGAIPLA